MVKGVGIDSASMDIMRRSVEALGVFYTARVFSVDEVLRSQESCDEIEYLTSRFAVKEATFKALAHLTRERTFDMRIVETLDCEDGHPEITQEGTLREVMESAGVSDLLVSITTQDDIATAIVVAQG